MTMRTSDARVLLVEVSNETIEDVALARHVDTAVMVDASSMLTTRMYDTFGETFEGWGRSLSLASVESSRMLWWHLFVVLFAQVAPIMLVFVGVATPVAIALLAMRLGTLVGTRKAYVTHDLAYWLSPFADVIAWWALVRGVVGRHRPQAWRGRLYA